MRLEPNDVKEMVPIIREIVRAVLDEMQSKQSTDGDAIALDERSAAESLGVPFHVLRDARRRGEIRAKKVGRKWLYSTEALRKFLEGESQTPPSEN